MRDVVGKEALDAIGVAIFKSIWQKIFGGS